MIQDKNRPALLIDDLSISVGKKQIIKDICLHVQEGLFMGLLGQTDVVNPLFLKQYIKLFGLKGEPYLYSPKMFCRCAGKN